MNIVQSIEQRINLPSDSETQRSQKLLAMGVVFFSLIGTLFNALRINSVGLPEVALVNLFLAATLAIAFGTVLAWPRSYYPVVIIVLLISLIGNLLTHFFSGGFTSGMLYISWTIATLVLAALFVGRRAVLAFTGGYILVVLLAGYLEPRAQAYLPQIDASTITMTAMINLIILGLITAGAILYLFNQVERYRRRADDLLLNILPGSIAMRLKETPGTIADGYNEVTVLFADIVDFTTMSAAADPVDVVSKLNEIFSEFDDLAAKHGLEKIKTIGDAYMVAGGLPAPQPDHVEAVAAFALEMLEAIGKHQSWTGAPIRLRVGINTGPVVAGVIGRQKFIYDLWGDAVNVASRMESNSLANEIQVTEAVKERLGGRYTFIPRDPIPIKGKGLMVTYLLRPLPMIE